MFISVSARFQKQTIPLFAAGKSQNAASEQNCNVYWSKVSIQPILKLMCVIYSTVVPLNAFPCGLAAVPCLVVLCRCSLIVLLRFAALLFALSCNRAFSWCELFCSPAVAGCLAFFVLFLFRLPCLVALPHLVALPFYFALSCFAFMSCCRARVPDYVAPALLPYFWLPVPAVLGLLLRPVSFPPNFAVFQLWFAPHLHFCGAVYFVRLIPVYITHSQN